MPVQNPMPALYKRLQQAGIKTAFVKNTILPEWWQDDIAQNFAEYASVLSRISQASGIPLEILYDNDAEIPKPTNKYDVKFKKSKNTHNADILWAAEFGRFIARSVLRALPQASEQEKTVLCKHSASDIRRHILQSYRTVNLDTLLEYCFSCGIPVLHISQTKISPKPHGMATSIGGRAAIVLFVNHKQPSRSAFDIAHELGHIMLGHVEQEQTVLDEHIEGASNNDPFEEEANNFAKELLLGSKNLKLNSPQKLSPQQLIKAALQYGTNHSIDAGAVILNYAYYQDEMQLGMVALSRLEKYFNAPRMINEALLRRISLDELSYDAQDALLRALGFTEYPAFLTTANAHE
jgi:Zn-dependent peptidase ImmA (M78 family)